MTLTLEVLHVPDCPNLTPMLDRLRQITGLPIATREITTETDASAAGMAGSPTLLINGRDPFRDPHQPHSALACRLYRDEHDRLVSTPSAAQLRSALAAASGDVLSSWREDPRPQLLQRPCWLIRSGRGCEVEAGEVA